MDTQTHTEKTVVYKEGERPRKKPPCPHRGLGLSRSQQSWEETFTFLSTKPSGPWPFVTAARADSYDDATEAAAVTQGWAQPGGDGRMRAAGRGLDQTHRFPLKASGPAEKKGGAWYWLGHIWKRSLLPVSHHSGLPWALSRLPPNWSFSPPHLLDTVTLTFPQSVVTPRNGSYQKRSEGFSSSWSIWALSGVYSLLTALWKLGIWIHLVVFIVNSSRSNTHT